MKTSGYLELMQRAVHKINTTHSMLFGYNHKPEEKSSHGSRVKTAAGNYTELFGPTCMKALHSILLHTHGHLRTRTLCFVKTLCRDHYKFKLNQLYLILTLKIKVLF